MNKNKKTACACRLFFNTDKLFRVDRLMKLEAVIFLIESPHMKHEHCFAVKVNKKEDVGRHSVNSHGVARKLDGCRNDIDPHMRYEML